MYGKPLQKKNLSTAGYVNNHSRQDSWLKWNTLNTYTKCAMHSILSFTQTREVHINLVSHLTQISCFKKRHIQRVYFKKGNEDKEMRRNKQGLPPRFLPSLVFPYAWSVRGSNSAALKLTYISNTTGWPCEKEYFCPPKAGKSLGFVSHGRPVCWTSHSVG